MECLIYVNAEASNQSINDFFFLPLWWRVLQTNHTALILLDRTWRTVHILLWLPKIKWTSRVLFLIRENISYFTFFQLYVIYTSKLSNIMAIHRICFKLELSWNLYLSVSITIIVKVITEFRNKGENTNLKLN
jgi:hypothetical protein